jgi:hypothetical protein
MDDKTMKRMLAGTTLAGALGLGALGIGSGIAVAKPNHPGPNPPGPSVTHNDDSVASDDVDLDDENEGTDDENGGTAAWFPGMPPGQNPLGPPGQVKKLPTIGGIANPFFGVPPGQWGNVNIDVPETWQPNLPGVTEPLTLEFNADLGQWGVFVNGTFVPYPIPLPADGLNI